jgi:hypothetical protein
MSVFESSTFDIDNVAGSYVDGSNSYKQADRIALKKENCENFC